MNFHTEKEMSLAFRGYLDRIIKIPNVNIFDELKGLFGIPDYVIIESNEFQLSNYIIAVELKLKNWNRALIQSFRYKSFANLSYVILDETNINNAIENIHKFKKFNVGLASFNKNYTLKIYHQPICGLPYSEFIYKKLCEKTIAGCSKKAINNNLGSGSILKNTLSRFLVQ